MRKSLLIFALPLLLLSCTSKKSTDTSEANVSDLVEKYPDIKLPYQVGDSALSREHNAAGYIPSALFASFIPDSIWTPIFGKTAHPRCYPLGKVTLKGNETYLFTRLSTPTKKAIFVVALNKELSFLAGLPVMATDSRPGVTQLLTMDSKYVLTTLSQRKNAAGEPLYRKNVYVYNTAGVFTLILTESNDATTTASNVLNPVDTFPAKNKLSGDYIQDKRNFISVRDARVASHLLFFIHFEKDNGNCKGELKGEMILQSPTAARYTQRGGPCIIEFSFSGRSVSMKEVGGCGANRDIRCFFEGSFTKKKPQPPAKLKKTKSSTKAK